MTVLVASTVAPYKNVEDEAVSWLTHARQWRDSGHDFFLASERVPGKHVLSEAIEQLVRHFDGEVWTFSVDTNEDRLVGNGRLVRICTGRNLCHEWFNRHPGRWEGILFLDTDVVPPADAPERLLEVDHPIVGFDVPTYCLDGPRVLSGWDEPSWWLERSDSLTVYRDDGPWFPEGADVREHWNTAGALLVRDKPARMLRWRWDLSLGQTDDPCFQADAVRMGFGQTWVRHDVVGEHRPGVIYPLEQRGLDLSL